MAAKKKIEWPTAAVMCVFLASLAAVYVLVPEHRSEIMAGVTVVGSTLLSFMRPMIGVVPPPAVRVRREAETIPPEAP